MEKIYHKFLSLKRDYLMRLAWEKISINFDHVSSPSRPSPCDMLCYASALDKLRRPLKILVLGATPELRLLASEFSSRVVVIDFSLGMFKKTNAMISRDIQDNEEKILGDWLDLPELVKMPFDAVLGDLVIRQLPPSNTGRFLAAVKGVLAKNSLFITRSNVKNPLWSYEKAADIIREGAKKYFLEKIQGFLSTTMFRLYDACTEKENSLLNWRKLGDAFGKAAEFALDPEEKEFIKKLRKSIGKHGAQWTHIPQETLEEILKKNFSIASVQYAADYPDAEFFPLYVLAKS